MRRYAEDSAVPVEKSREQINRILQAWKCEAIGWMDNYAQDKVVLQFIVPRLIPGTQDPIAYRAQFSVKLKSEASIRKECHGPRGFSEPRYSEAMSRRGRREHRVLHLWIKAALEAVTEGIVPFESIFLPFFVREDGQTVAESVQGTLHKALGAPVSRMLKSVN